MKISFSRISWLSLLAGLAFTPNGWAQSQQAVSSEDFVDSIGVNTHFANCLDSTCIWYSGNFTQITSALTNLGIKNIREGLIPSYASNPTSAYAKELTSLAQAGILVDMITSGTTEQGAIASQVSAIQAINSGTIPVVGAVEGPNESDLDGNFMYNGMGFPGGTVAFQEALYSALISNTATQNLTIIGPSEGMIYSGTANPMGTGTLYAYVDLGCFHPYSYGGNPFTGHFAYDTIVNWYYQAAQPASISTDAGQSNWAFSVYQPPFTEYSGTSIVLQRPMAATERGWYTGSAQESVSQATFAKYIPRLFAEDFYDGIPLTYSYEFMDETGAAGWSGSNSQDNYGLVYSNFTPKPAYTALQNLIALTSDTNGSFAPGSLNFAVTVAPPNGYQASIALHHLLLEKSNGTYQLMMWNDISSSSLTDTNGNTISSTARDISPPLFPTTVTFLTPMLTATINSIQSSGSVTTTTGTFVNNAFTVNVPDNVMVINLIPNTLAPGYTWVGNTGNWSTASNWWDTSGQPPSASGTASITTYGSYTINNDVGASGTVGVLNLFQTGSNLTTLQLQKNLTVGSGGSVCSTSSTGGASINLGNYIFTVGPGATFVLGSTTGTNVVENTSNAAQEWLNTAGTGYVDVKGTLEEANISAAGILPSVNAAIKVETGGAFDLYNNPSAAASNRLTISGNFTTDPSGALTIESTGSFAGNNSLFLSGTLINIGTGAVVTGFGVDAITLSGGTQTISLGATIPNGFGIRDFNSGTLLSPYTMVEYLSSNANDGTHANAIDEIKFQPQSSYSTIDMVLGSNLNLATGQSMPFNFNFTGANGGDVTVDVNGYAYNETTATMASFAPSGTVGGGTNQFSIVNSGASSIAGGNGIFEAGSFNLSGADVAVGNGVILQAITANQTNNLGFQATGVTTINPGSTLYFSGTGAASAVTSNRTIGGIVVGTGASASTLKLSSTITAAGNVTVNSSATLDLNAKALNLVGAANLLGGGSIISSSSAATVAVSGSGGVSPGGAGTVGTLNLGANVTLTLGGSSVSTFNITGTNAYSSIAGGTVINNGTLNLNFVSFTPTLNETFALFSGGTDSGTFSSITSNIAGLSGTFNPATGSFTVTTLPGTNYSWISTNGNWSTVADWSPTAPSGGPGSSGSATVTTNGSDTVDYDIGAPGVLAFLNLYQTKTYLSTLQLQQNLTINSGAVISSTSSTNGASLNLGNYTLTVAPGATFVLGSTTGTNVVEGTGSNGQLWLNTTGTGYVDVKGTLEEATVNAAGSLPSINVPVKLEAGSTLNLYDNPNASASNRLTVSGNFTTDPTGAVTIECTGSYGSVLYLSGTYNNIGTGTVFTNFGVDDVAFVGGIQTVNLGTTIPNGFNIRDFIGGSSSSPYIMYEYLSSNASDGTHADALDEIKIEPQSVYSTIDIVLESNLNLATGQSAPFSYNYTGAMGGNAMVDLHGYVYDATTATTTAFAPTGTVGGTNQFIFANSGASSISGNNGIFRAGSFSLAGADVAIGNGVILQAVTANQTNNLGTQTNGVTTINPGSILYYSGTGTAPGVTSNRTIGGIVIGSGSSASTLKLASAITAAGTVTINGGATLDLNAKALTLTGTGNLLLLSGGSIISTGSAGTVNVSGTGGVSPGGAGTVGPLTLASNVTMALGANATITFDVTGASTYDQVSGGTTTNGGATLNLNFVGFTPTANETFTLFTGGTDSGTFSTITSNISGLTGTFNPATGVFTVTTP